MNVGVGAILLVTAGVAGCLAEVATTTQYDRFGPEVHSLDVTNFGVDGEIVDWVLLNVSSEGGHEVRWNGSYTSRSDDDRSPEEARIGGGNRNAPCTLVAGWNSEEYYVFHDTGLAFASVGAHVGGLGIEKTIFIREGKVELDFNRPILSKSVENTYLLVASKVLISDGFQVRFEVNGSGVSVTEVDRGTFSCKVGPDSNESGANVELAVGASPRKFWAGVAASQSTSTSALALASVGASDQLEYSLLANSRELQQYDTPTRAGIVTDRYLANKPIHFEQQIDLLLDGAFGGTSMMVIESVEFERLAQDSIIFRDYFMVIEPNHI